MHISKKLLLCICVGIVSCISNNICSQNMWYGYHTPHTYYDPYPSYSKSFWHISLTAGPESLSNPSGDFLDMKATYAAGLSFGRAFCLNNESDSDIGIYLDWTIIDILFTDYSRDYMKRFGAGTTYFFNTDIASFIGPRINIGDLDEFNIGIYGRYAPTFTTCTNGMFRPYDNAFSHQISAGIDFSYGFISLGIDFRRGYTKCDLVLKDDYANIVNQSTALIQKNNILAHLSLRF